RPVLLTPVGLRPPSVSKTDLLNLKLSRLFCGLTSLTNEQILTRTIWMLSNSNNTILEIVQKQPAQSATGEKSPNTSSKLLSTNMVSEKSEKSSRKNKYSMSESNEMDTQNDTRRWKN
ncbi:MAG: hypothetical protein J6L24_04190, partial [Oscillospiraceae bacterium]|nr:hypothetical protein [Oscillospiraceae bacterium]